MLVLPFAEEEERRLVGNRVPEASELAFRESGLGLRVEAGPLGLHRDVEFRLADFGHDFGETA